MYLPVVYCLVPSRLPSPFPRAGPDGVSLLPSRALPAALPTCPMAAPQQRTPMESSFWQILKRPLHSPCTYYTSGSSSRSSWPRAVTDVQTIWCDAAPHESGCSHRPRALARAAVLCGSVVKSLALPSGTRVQSLDPGRPRPPGNIRACPRLLDLCPGARACPGARVPWSPCAKARRAPRACAPRSPCALELVRPGARAPRSPCAPEPVRPGAHARQQEKPPQGGSLTPPLEESPHGHRASAQPE